MIQWVVLGAIALIGAAVLSVSAIKKLLNQKLGKRGWMYAEVEEIIDMAYTKGKKVKLTATTDMGYDQTVYVDAEKLDSDVYEGSIIIN